MRILGIDPGSLRTGYGAIDVDGRALTAVAYGTVAPPAGLALGARLTFIAAQLAELARDLRPELIAIESLFTARSPRAALVLGQARGAALVGVGSSGAPVVEMAPAAVKSAVAGHGRAPKAQVARAVRELLQLSGKIGADASDALAIALSAAFRRPAPGATEPRLRVRRVSARDAWTEELRREARAARRS
ncbi:MAG: crossover junction endodeoxyribonuclease RuvC [Deltaproteobacteria bacterium]|nr:crossover junction endodeoxyribonuclease RuvC [Deltaproteobacteria bacterium]